MPRCLVALYSNQDLHSYAGNPGITNYYNFIPA
jgi:hypothetical protein